jgi:hypothetical protein
VLADSTVSYGRIVGKPAALMPSMTASSVPVGVLATARICAVVLWRRTTLMSRYWGPQSVPMSNRIARPYACSSSAEAWNASDWIPPATWPKRFGPSEGTA